MLENNIINTNNNLGIFYKFVNKHLVNRLCITAVVDHQGQTLITVTLLMPLITILPLLLCLVMETLQIFLSLIFLLLIILTLVKVTCLLQSGSLRIT